MVVVSLVCDSGFGELNEREIGKKTSFSEFQNSAEQGKISSKLDSRREGTWIAGNH